MMYKQASAKNNAHRNFDMVINKLQFDHSFSNLLQKT